MTMVKLNQPARPFGTLLDDWFQEFPSFIGREVSQALPQAPVNIVETIEAYHLEMIAPGRSKEDFKVTLENGLLTIAFNQKSEEKNPEPKMIRKEFNLASFKRTFTVDEKIDGANIQAKYEAGLLKLLLPKKNVEKPQPREITIQ